jgi:4-carboxymuconolactone decarboxylase
MKLSRLALTMVALLLTACATTEKTSVNGKQTTVLAAADARAVSPALAHNTDSLLLGEVWKRPGLSPRDRSLITVAVLIARNQTVEGLPLQSGSG